jgi:hypothetical protein
LFEWASAKAKSVYKYEDYTTVNAAVIAKSGCTGDLIESARDEHRKIR